MLTISAELLASELLSAESSLELAWVNEWDQVGLFAHFAFCDWFVLNLFKFCFLFRFDNFLFFHASIYTMFLYSSSSCFYSLCFNKSKILYQSLLLLFYAVFIFLCYFYESRIFNVFFCFFLNECASDSIWEKIKDSSQLIILVFFLIFVFFYLNIWNSFFFSSKVVFLFE